MNLEKASRKKAKIKMCLQGPSGSGKTYSSLLLAYGLCNDWSKIAIVDTENHSAELYSHLGEYNVLQLTAPYTPEKYIQAVQICEKADMEVIILDSISHEWQYIIEAHALLAGNSFANWHKLTPRHKEFVKTILSSKANVIATTRTKQDYVLNERNGKMVPEKVGLKAIQRDDLEYEFSLVFDLNMKNQAAATKDITGLFYGQPEHKIGIQTGLSIYEWCNMGIDDTANKITSRINDCKSIAELLNVYNNYPLYKQALKPEYENRKRQILIQEDVSINVQP